MTLEINPLFFYIWRVNWRWYFTGIIVALAFFGISIEQSAVPNQEIVVQFSADSISADEAQQAISEITSQLKTIGVADVQISKLLDGKLKVTYYSTIDVAVIKNLFQKQNKLHFGDTAFNKKDTSSKIPFSSDSNTYKLDVIKIQKDFGSDLGLHGFPVELKSAKDQFLNPYVSLRASETDFVFKQGFERVVFKNYRDASLLIDNASHKIPEVRAGPLS
ncbi:hypothetical protein A7A78_03780 [Aequorivita soesokkakensis]|uniref:Uncharacterized protein n=1 Tax=Aequorivita soesokkakensis TaxID=1385699 RepID=A0A1A9LEB3_9FLAO|nr:hypothetical protein [Aequorivita soesokkakensis]OAD91610.1 hypothetical protein A7A78_03780 [Aequorivita soesokkakensis]